MRVEAFDFTLPQDRIATEPLEQRDQAKLLHVSANTLTDRQVADLPSLLRPGDVLVCNDSKVIPARLLGRRGEAAIELLLHQPESGAYWRCFARPAKKLKPGDDIVLADDFNAQVVEKRPETGEVIIAFDCEGEAFMEKLEGYGHVPLPPYMQREDRPEDKQHYQTIYAREKGSVAAPTAGLHFTPGLLEKLKQAGVEVGFVTLHVGAGTFKPVQVEDTSDHLMHYERGVVSQELCEAVRAAKAAGGRVVAVGTTSLRLLESAADDAGNLSPYCGETNLFITPGYRFKLVDVLMTNFHLPKSTLFMLVSAFSGLERMQAAYQHAIRNGYRFYSYGDACLLERAA